jgi:hypothetical protein
LIVSSLSAEQSITTRDNAIRRNTMHPHEGYF